MKAFIHGSIIAYEDVGQGEPILLLHGFPLDHQMWNEQIAALKVKYRVIAPDLRGMGGSDVPTAAISLDQYADDILALLDQLEIPTVILGGFSMGGYIAFSLLRKAPQRFKAVVLADTRPEGDPKEGRKNRMNMAAALYEHGSSAARAAMLPKLLTAQTQKDKPELVAKLTGTIDAMKPEGLVHACLAMAFRKDSVSLLPLIKVPTLVIVGEKDAITPPAVMKKMADQIPHVFFVQIPDAAHLTPLENPDKFNQALLGFLQGLS
jgi:3-oxoadipate enol-lactonase